MKVLYLKVFLKFYRILNHIPRHLFLVNKVNLITESIWETGIKIRKLRHML